MDSKKDIYVLWIHYTTENEEVYFRQFISGFVSIWESQLNMEWDNAAYFLDPIKVNPNAGPHLSRLPEELLPAIGKFLYITKDTVEKDDILTVLQLQEAQLLIKSLILISRNFQNISQLTCCDYVKLCISVASTLISKVKENKSKEINEEAARYCIVCCHLLECIYDPYLTWRYFRQNNKLIGNYSQIHNSTTAAVLHIEVIPFIYECFDLKVKEYTPLLAKELINVLGAIVSGSQVNALQGVCPATASLLVTIISDVPVLVDLQVIAVKCFILMIHTLLSSQPYQRQIELGTLIELYRDGMINMLTSRNKNETNDYSSTDNISVMVNMLTTLIDISGKNAKACIRSIMVQNYILESLVDTVESCKINSDETLILDCIRSLAAITKSSNLSKERMLKISGYNRVFRKLKLLENHSHPLLAVLIELTIEDTYCETKTYQLKNAKLVVLLLELIPTLSIDSQEWLSLIIFSICSCNLQCRWKALKCGTLKAICLCLSKYEVLSSVAINQLINLLESLASISVTTCELKYIFGLFRMKEIKLVPYCQKLLHAILNVARVSGLTYCRSYFDIQSVSDGLTVPDIKKWPGPLYGLTFHCWISLNKADLTDDFAGNHGVPSFRRQIFTLFTPVKQGIEIFISAENSIVVGINTKKEFLTVTECDHFLDEERWYCLDISYTPSKRPFGQNLLTIFVDGVQKVAANVKFPPMTEAFTWCKIGAPIDDSAFECNTNGSSISNYTDSSDRGILPSFISQVPSYISLPLRTGSLNPNLKSFPPGMQDTLFGQPASLCGQLGTVCLFQEPLSTQQIKVLYDTGPNCNKLFCSEDNMELSAMYSKLVFSYSPSACAFDHAIDLAGKYKLAGRITAQLCDVRPVKEVISSIGGVHVLFLLLETEDYQNYHSDADCETTLCISTSSDPKDNTEDNAVIPFLNYSEAQLEENPVATIIILMNNLIKENIGQELFLKRHGFSILGELLTKVSADLLDILVLNSVHLLVETARSTRNAFFTRSLYQHILFNFEIWIRCPIDIKLSHAQFLLYLIKSERKYFRKRFGIQFFLDTIRRYYSSAMDLLETEQSKQIRAVIIDIIKVYIQKDTNIYEITGIVRYICSSENEVLITEVLDMLINYLESKYCRDQIFLLLYEPNMADTLYALLCNQLFSMECKQKILRLFSVLLRTDRVYERSKARLRLQDASNIGMYPGLISMLPESQLLSMEVALMLLDQILLSDSYGSITGALSLLYALSLTNLDIKLEAARKVLTVVFMRPNVPSIFAKQAGWQECITRLLIQHPLNTAQNTPLPNFIFLDTMEESSNTTAIVTSAGYHEEKNDSYFLSDISTFLDTEVKDNIHYAADNLTSVAETVSSVVSENISFAKDNISTLAGNVTSVVTDNVCYATENISSVVNTAYSLIKETTTNIQEGVKSASENLRTISESKLSPSEMILKPDEDLSSNLNMENLSLTNSGRSYSCSSIDEILFVNPDSRSNLEENTDLAKSKDEISLTSTQSVSSGEVVVDYNDEDHVLFDMLQEWKNLEDGKTEDKEFELCYTVVNILFTIMWRGYNANSRAVWKERGQVITCINMIGLNNALYCSHNEIKLRLFEMMVQAALTDLIDTTRSSENIHTRAENAAHLLRWIYDLIVLDPNPNDTKRASVQLLDGVIGLLDALLVFKENSENEWTEMVKVSFGILLKCTESLDLELCAMAAAKLHTLIQIRNIIDIEECSYLLYHINEIMKKDYSEQNLEHYSFLVPVIKTIINKLSGTLSIQEYVPELLCSQPGPRFVENIQRLSQEPEWNEFIQQKVKPLYERYQSLLSTGLNEAMNLFWAECYEAAKISAQKRNKDIFDSRMRFHSGIMKPFQTKQTEENARYNNMLNQCRNRKLLIAKRWCIQRDFLCGPRGPWKYSDKKVHWTLSHHENFSRMRLKLVPNLHFNLHADASHLRDNTGWARFKGIDKNPMTMSISQAALRKEPESNPDQISEEDLFLSALEQSEVDNKIQSSQGKEKILMSCDCQLVTLMSVIKGKIDITPTQFCFYDFSPIKEDTDRHDFKWSLSKLREVHLRRYNLRKTALEFFLTDQTNYFLNFNKQTRKDTISTIFKLRPPNMSFHSYRSPADLLRSSGLTQKWVNREITNFDYLMQLNTIAGRTYNDLSQYPVFPWIIADYSSEQLDLTNPKTFRNLSRPIGVVNPQNEAEVRNKYNTFEDPYGVIAKFHYGTHYSNSGGVLHYMVRVEPFTSLHIDLQSGRFDVADRQFHSIPQTWKLLMENPNDVKELIPEFFYFPEFLKNINKFDLGTLQGTKEQVDDVILPKWASSPEDFIDKHRKALESEYVSSHLNEWIDLIFGYKQRGENAVEALNVFYYCSYEGAVDLDAISDTIEREAVEGMINNFGQTPSQLLKEPHPARLSLDEALYRMLKTDFKNPDFTLFFELLNHFHVEIANDLDPVIFISSPKSSPKGFLHTTSSDKLVTVSRNGLIGLHSWLPYDKNSTRGFSLDVDQSLNNLKSRRDISGSFHPSIKLHGKLFVVSHDTKFLFSAGHWDDSIKVYSFARNKIVYSTIRHTDVVTCLAADVCGWYVISGSKDCTCIIWDITQINYQQPPTPYQLLNGHDEPISTVAIATELDMAVSGSLDGTVNVYSINDGQLVRTLTPSASILPVSEITFVTISFQGHIAFSATDKVNHSVHVFSINGENLGEKCVLGQITGITTASDCLVVVDDAGDLTISKLLGLQILYTASLHIPIQSVVTTSGNTHLLVPLRDGQLVITGLPTK